MARFSNCLYVSENNISIINLQSQLHCRMDGSALDMSEWLQLNKPLEFDESQMKNLENIS